MDDCSEAPRTLERGDALMMRIKALEKLHGLETSWLIPNPW
jgi:hypothetical protein